MRLEPLSTDHDDGLWEASRAPEVWTWVSEQPATRDGFGRYLDAARAASADGHWRDAIHLAYWCGISFLEAQQAWRPDASRTPREYTRAFAETGPRADALAQFTSLLERVWYAGDAADATRFDEALSHLGALGCPAR